MRSGLLITVILGAEFGSLGCATTEVCVRDVGLVSVEQQLSGKPTTIIGDASSGPTRGVIAAPTWSYSVTRSSDLQLQFCCRVATDAALGADGRWVLDGPATTAIQRIPPLPGEPFRLRLELGVKSGKSRTNRTVVWLSTPPSNVLWIHERPEPPKVLGFALLGTGPFVALIGLFLLPSGALPPPVPITRSNIVPTASVVAAGVGMLALGFLFVSLPAGTRTAWASSGP